MVAFPIGSVAVVLEGLHNAGHKVVGYFLHESSHQSSQ